MLNPNDFLTAEESIAVDQSLLSAKEKFSTRVAIYSLRVLQTMISDASFNIPNDLSQISPSDIATWLTHNQPATAEATPGLEPDPAFNQFFTQIVLSAIRPLSQIAADTQRHIGELGPADVIAWFEKEAKIRVEVGEKATFLGQPDA